MNPKKKKIKNATKLEDEEKNLRNSNKNNKNTDKNNENNILNRINTKIIKKKKKEKEKDNKNEEDKSNKRTVKFGKIDIIDVECWKTINSELTAEENIEELYKLAETQENKRKKNIGCRCIII